MGTRSNPHWGGSNVYQQSMVWLEIRKNKTKSSSHVKIPTEFLTPIFAENITCKIYHWIYQTLGIRSNTSQMWTIKPNSSQLWYIRQNSSHVKNPTEFLTHIFADNVTCNLLDRLYQTWVIQWYSAHMWQKSIEFIQDVTYWTEYIICEKSDRISHTYICRKYQM